MNNAIRTILGILAFVSAGMTALGQCVADNPLTAVVGDAVCSASWIPTAYTSLAAMLFTAVALALKMVRPGGALAGLFGETAVVSAFDKVGTVTPAQVDSGKPA